ncbi:hypothetical protein [Streptomyces sp. SAI-127]|nr:hypothetical protein [Streptomyces sp. SAI-127]MDH6493759.1 hypothetical protein [Streptomyces sp. SAI-127]
MSGREEHFLRELRSAKARYRRVRDLMVDAAAVIPDYRPSA